MTQTTPFAGALSFNFGDVNLDSNGIDAIPVNVPLVTKIKEVSAEQTPNGPKLVIKQDVHLDASGESTAGFTTRISTKQAWLMAGYLNAIGEDYKSLSGAELTPQALHNRLAGQFVLLTFRTSNYTKDDGTPGSSKQVQKVTPYAVPQVEKVVASDEVVDDQADGSLPF